LIITALLFWKAQWPKSKRAGPKKLHPALLPAVCGLLGTIVLITGQLVYEPQQYELETLESLPDEPLEIAETPDNNAGSAEPVATATLPEPPVSVSEQPDIPDPVPDRPRTLSLAKGRVRLKMDEVPILGSPDAENVAGLMYDYTCKHCRELHHKIGEALEKYNDQLAIAMLPLPLDKTCNRLISKTSKSHEQACEYAKLALVVWKKNPAAFPEFDNYLVAGKKPPPLDQARARAAETLGIESVDMLLNQSDILSWIIRNVGWYGALDKGSIPKLLMPDQLLTGKVASVNVLCRILERAYSGLHAVDTVAPETAKDLTDFGMVLLREKEYEEATARFRQALSLDPNYAWAYTGLGQVYQVKRDYAVAVDEYRRAHQLDPKDVLTINSLAWILATHPDFGPDNQQEALTLARLAAKLTGNKNMHILNTLSAACANAGLYEEAISTIDKAIALAQARKKQKIVTDLTARRQLYQARQPVRLKITN
jgi:Tfp pilus assembly protein PilF